MAPLEQLLQGKTSSGKPMHSGLHKDSVGRIRRDIKEENKLLTTIETPHVTDDILGIGRRKQEQKPDSLALVPVKDENKMVVAKDEKKRGRINFVWNRNKRNQRATRPLAMLPRMIRQYSTKSQ